MTDHQEVGLVPPRAGSLYNSKCCADKKGNADAWFARSAAVMTDTCKLRRGRMRPRFSEQVWYLESERCHSEGVRERGR